jgi:3-deoxy-D-manno-octulosonic-acid transferase
MILVYRILTTLIYPLLFIFILIRLILKKEDPNRYKEKILTSHFRVTRKKNTKLIWFHAASIGEFKSILPIIKKLSHNNELEFLVTTLTLSSSNIAKEEFKKFDNIHHRFLPFDVGFLINKFLLMWEPHVIFFVDSEIWPNLIINANKNKIPLALINARITSKTFNKWVKISQTAKKIFSLFDLCLASNLETKAYLKKLNAKNIYFYGNIKFISQINENNIKNDNEKILAKNRFWIAASTHQGEDDLCLKTHLMLREKYNDIITIIAPRHIQRSEDIKSKCDDYNLTAQILNKGELILNNKEIVIINSYGVLNDYFKYAKSVFIGKSTLKKLKDVGGQNPIDAAKLGCKIYNGPYVYNFSEVYRILEENFISKKISNHKELGENLIKDLDIKQKSKNRITNVINGLGSKTLADTMKKINNFI